MIEIRELEDGVWVSGQVGVDDLTSLAEAGFSILVNHRPDHEDADQPTAAALGDSACALGMRVINAPVNGWPVPSAIETTATALAALPEGTRALLFCRSGMRSAVVWALARRAQGASADDLRKAAADAGYDLSRVPL